MAKTVRTCRQLLKVESALWLFVTVEGLEPTNNAAERAIRPAVLWRRTRKGSQSQAGSIFVARMRHSSNELAFNEPQRLGLHDIRDSSGSSGKFSTFRAAPGEFFNRIVNASL